MEIGTLVGMLAFGVSAGNALYNWRRNTNIDIQAMRDAIAVNSTEIALLKKQGDLFWGLVEQQMAKALIRPTHIELDRLLEKIVRDEPLNTEQETRLHGMLHNTINNKNEAPGVRGMAAVILAIRQAKERTKLNQTPPCD